MLIAPSTFANNTSPHRMPVAQSTLPADAADDMALALIEISTGQQQKWQQDHQQPNWLEWEHKKGEPRWIAYLGYPANYGIIPNTLAAIEDGGDGDPLDVLVLGSPIPQGHMLAVRVIGVMTMLDDGEQDDKLIAVDPQHPVFGSVNDIEQLQNEFTGLTDILRIWFQNYKGEAGNVTELSIESKATALALLKSAADF
ncbi:MAG: inorganic diphosphatase [Idiomarina sp.]|nr:inorganic diphosphatase [Idiomarina sp.]